MGLPSFHPDHDCQAAEMGLKNSFIGLFSGGPDFFRPAGV
jgi:hypothetical protein